MQLGFNVNPVIVITYRIPPTYGMGGDLASPRSTYYMTRAARLQ